jgi:thiol-disulfide isomerase/thioredoxin
MKKVQKNYAANGRNVLIEGYIKNENFIPHGDVLIDNQKSIRELSGKYINGRPSGLWKRWYEDGTIQSEHSYKNGILNGPAKQYFDNGQIAFDGFFQDGIIDKINNFFNRKGKKDKTFLYNKGKLLSGEYAIQPGSKEWIKYELERNLVFPWDMVAEKICVINQKGEVECTTPRELYELLLTLMSPEDAAKIMEGVKAAFDDLGLDKNKKVLTNCGGTFVSTTLDTTASDTKKPSTNEELDEIMDACKKEATESLTPNGITPGNSNDRGTQDAISKIDDAVNNCVSSDNSMISEIDGWEAAGIAVGFVVVVGATGAVGLGSTLLLGSVYVLTSTEALAAGGVMATATFTVGATILNGLISSDATSDAAEKAKEAAIEAAKAAARETAKIEEEKRKAQQQPQTPNPGRPAGPEGSGDKCEQFAEWWERKKEYCEQSNWQSYDCMEVLRIFTGCADPALVYPTPDGGIGCPLTSSMTDEDWRRLECERRSMIEMPSGFDSKQCMSADKFELPSRDICSDPRAMCRPDMLVPNEAPDAQFPFINKRTVTKNKIVIQQKSIQSIFSNYAKLKMIDDLSFDKEISNSKNKDVAFVAFVSKSCGPCHKVLNVFNDEATAAKTNTFHYVDVSQNPELSAKFDIKYTPTIIAFKKGEIVGQRRVGAASKEVLVAYLKRSNEIK